MDHADLAEELAEIEKLTAAERIAIARQRRAFQLLKWQERETAAETILNGSGVDGVTVRTLYERKPKVVFSSDIMLLEATARNDLDEVRRLLNDGADPNSHNEDGLTPLHQCAIDNNDEMLQLFLNHHSDVNARDTELWTPLHAAACCGHSAIVRRLIDSGAHLLAVNADGNMPYDICDDEYTLDLIESEMAKRGITQEDIDDERLSIERRMLDDLQTLRDSGGDLECRDGQGAAPLHIASANGYYSCVQFLLDCGCSTDVRDDDGWQPVHLAACWAQADILELLAAYGADINARTPLNETPLDLCDDEAVRALIMTLQVEAQRRMLSFGRDSRRLSKRRKPSSKFESPTASTPSGAVENHLAATRGAIRRLSVRDRSGVTLARLEARREAEILQRFEVDGDDVRIINQEVQDNIGKDSTDLNDTSSLSGSPSRTNNHVEDSTTALPTVTTGLAETSDANERVDQSLMDTTTDPGNSSEYSSEQAISTSDWLRKVREEEQAVSANLERSSMQRKGRRRQTPAGSNGAQNGPISGAPDPLYPTGARPSDQVVFDSSQPRTRTLSPGEPSFSRHPKTLIDLKKQRSEERKMASSPAGQARIQDGGYGIQSADGCLDVPDGQNARYRSPVDSIVTASPPRSPKTGLRCCRIT